MRAHRRAAEHPGGKRARQGDDPLARSHSAQHLALGRAWNDPWLLEVSARSSQQIRCLNVPHACDRTTGNDRRMPHAMPYHHFESARSWDHHLDLTTQVPRSDTSLPPSPVRTAGVRAAGQQVVGGRPWAPGGRAGNGAAMVVNGSAHAPVARGARVGSGAPGCAIRPRWGGVPGGGHYQGLLGRQRGQTRACTGAGWPLGPWGRRAAGAVRAGGRAQAASRPRRGWILEMKRTTRYGREGVLQHCLRKGPF